MAGAASASRDRMAKVVRSCGHGLMKADVVDEDCPAVAPGGVHADNLIRYRRQLIARGPLGRRAAVLLSSRLAASNSLLRPMPCSAVSTTRGSLANAGGPAVMKAPEPRRVVTMPIAIRGADPGERCSCQPA
jgi:hypothetical protein